MKVFKVLSLCLLGGTVVLASNSLSKDAISHGLKAIPQSKSELFKLIDNPKNPITSEKIELGKKLYFDPRLSKSGLISCNTCHNIGLGGADGLSTAVGHMWAPNPQGLNSPTVYNAVFFGTQFWDGRSPDLEDQAQGPIQAHVEMAAPKELVEKRINSIPEYVEEFKRAYGDDVKIDFKKIADTIATFERVLVTPSRFDDFLHGHSESLDEYEKRGLKTFLRKGCASCHTGIAVGGGMGAFVAFADHKEGDFKGNDDGMMKIPTLRNITETAPYFHDGRTWDLREAVQKMGYMQLNSKLSKEEVDEIIAFLRALKGRKPDISYPQLPESTLSTPIPDLY